MAQCMFNLLVSITHGADELEKASGGSIQESIEFLKDYAGGLQATSCVAIQRYDVNATARFHKFQTPVVRATNATLTYNLKDNEGTAGSVSITTMLAGDASFSFDSPPFEQGQSFTYAGTSLAPISVA